METREEKLKSLDIDKKQMGLLSDSALVGENIITDVLFHATELKIIPSKQTYNDLLEALLLVDKKGVLSIYTTEEINKIQNAINKATK